MYSFLYFVFVLCFTVLYTTCDSILIIIIINITGEERVLNEG